MSIYRQIHQQQQMMQQQQQGGVACGTPPGASAPPSALAVRRPVGDMYHVVRFPLPGAVVR